MATIDEVYAQNVTIIANIAALQADVDFIITSLDAVDTKLDLLSGDTTSTNVLDKVLSIERRTKAMEFKIMKGK